MLCSYSVNEFVALPHYQLAKHKVGLSEVKTAIDELGNIIVLHGLESQVGVCLLHKHFDIDNDEILLETAYDNISKLLPVSRDTVQNDVLAYMWKMNNNKTWSPLEFTYSTQQMRDTFKKVMKNEIFLQEIGETMLKLQVTHIFIQKMCSNGSFAII